MSLNEYYNTIKDEIEQYKDSLRENLLVFTRQAFHELPKMQNPHILDIGCGSGVPTIELAGLSGGWITAVDTDQYQLGRLSHKIQNLELSGRIKVVQCSMLDLGNRGNTYDIIWAEGSIAVIGFNKGLYEWGRMLKSPGYLAVHDAAGNIEEKLMQISQNSYRLIDYFMLEPDIWWDKYYAGLEKKIKEIGQIHASDPGISAMLEEEQAEINDFSLHPEQNRSVFFVMEKQCGDEDCVQIENLKG
ncbi:MAG: class I SAM-dependent methyltransferase [Dehalococcoidia bacterium]|nr:class I SAM-dependent methyltransferase [Dehalococcoidia bacterium]